MSRRGSRRTLHKLEEDQEIRKLENRIEAEKPAKGFNPLAYDTLPEDYTAHKTAAKLFSELPISKRTLKGLDAGNWTQMTSIQRAAIPHALAGRDVLGAARTGSGKTLAFLVPVLEKLYRSRWRSEYGLGALIISPTRELALQIFEVLRTVGAKHRFSAGLIIGGKSFEEEQTRIGTMNILVCTPGRLLQHMDQTASFDCSNLQILVLDEADRILDLGFAQTVNSIIENLPVERQTLLFSATQTKSVSDLARLSLKEPEYISVHEKAKTATPKKLTHNAVFCELHEKMDLLYSFIKSHTKSKALVFFSSCNQVKFAYEAIRQLQPGVGILALHGKMKQKKRMAIFFDFCERQSAFLFATDIAARGLDFPAVDWVVQMDCPEDVAAYIHRAGRTARYHNDGRALLFLLPQERAMLDILRASKIPIEEIRTNPQKTIHVDGHLRALLAKDPMLKYQAQKCVVSYLRSWFLQKDKTVFPYVSALPAAEYAKSLGLISTPKLRFGQSRRTDKNESYELRNIKQQLESTQEAANESDTEHGQGQSTKKKKKDSVEKLLTRKNKEILSEDLDKIRAQYDDADSEDEDMLVPAKHQRHEEMFREDGHSAIPALETLSKRKRKKMEKENAPKPKKVVFDDEGNPITADEDSVPSGLSENTEEAASTKSETERATALKGLGKGGAETKYIGSKQYLEFVKEQMAMADEEDKQLDRQKKREKRLRIKEHERRMAMEELEQQGEEEIIRTIEGSSDDEAGERQSQQYDEESGEEEPEQSEEEEAVSREYAEECEEDPEEAKNYPWYQPELKKKKRNLAKEKVREKKQKKRKREELEREVLKAASGAAEEETEPSVKRRKADTLSLQEQEELALSILQTRG